MFQDDFLSLKNIGMNLQKISAQILNIAIQITNFNQYYGSQLKSMGNQISDMAMKIFSIGMQSQNMIKFSDPIPIQNIPNQINMNMLNQLNNIEINNNLNNKKEKIGGDIIFIYFIYDGKKVLININNKETVENLLNAFRLKMEKGHDFYGNHMFLFNGREVSVYEKAKIIDYGLSRGNVIEVISTNDIIGGP